MPSLRADSMPPPSSLLHCLFGLQRNFDWHVDRGLNDFCNLDTAQRIKLHLGTFSLGNEARIFHHRIE